MKSHEWRELLLSVGVLTQTVAVELNKCEGALREEWMTIGGRDQVNSYIITIAKFTYWLLYINDSEKQDCAIKKNI